MGIALLLGAVWGFAEATLFFIVPDVALTFIAILGPEHAWAACAAAVIGAVLGGGLIYLLGVRDTRRLTRAFVRIPAIDRREIAAVRARVGRTGFGAIFLGPLLGTPYKLYAAEAGRRRMSLPIFLFVTVPARAIRFVLATALWLWLAGGPLAEWSTTAVALLTTAAWVGFYAWYFRMKRRATRPEPARTRAGSPAPDSVRATLA